MSRKKRVIPAVLTDDPQVLATMVRQVETFTDYIQLDIMDGQFVPSRSITWEQMKKLSPKLNWEAHLMVRHPENCLENFRSAGAQRIIFHYEATDSPGKIIRQIRKLGLKAGLAINPETPVAAIVPLLNAVDNVLFLAVNPGFYGSKFIPEVLDKVRELRTLQPELEIDIDGGINESNIVTVAQSGADGICVGSAIFLQPDPAVSFRHLTALVSRS